MADGVPSHPGDPPETNFLSGGGELGARIREFDWRRTPLGPPERWPHGLKTAVRIMLTSRQPMWIGWGPELTYLYNDPYKSIIGGKHPAALGQPTSTVWREIWPEIGPRLARVLGLNEGTYDEALLLIMERNGYPEETYYTFSYSPIPDDRGGTGGIICANTDDTERVIRERQLALLRQLAAGSADARTVADACALSGRALQTDRRDIPFGLLYVLDGGGRLSLAARSGIEAGHPVAMDAADAHASAPWPFEEVLNARSPVLLQDLPRRDDLPTGEWDRPPKEVVLMPLARRGQEDLSGVLVLGLNPYRLFDDAYRGFVDLVASQVAAGIASARSYEEERRRAEALAEIDRAKTVFFSNVSHEFRTPLTLMLGPTADALASRDRALRGPDLEAVHRNGLRLLRLVNSLLDFSRIEAGRAQAAYEPVDLAETTRDLASLFQSATDRAGLDLIVDCGPIGAPVYVDRQMWEKIVLNLVSNAFKFTLAGSISVRLRRIDGHVELAVSDTGTGIPPDELPRLFERFHRVEGARGRTHEGTGIGLALVYELVKLHGGTVSATSEVDRGSTFTVTVPLGSAHLPADRVRPQAAPERVEIGGAQAFVSEALRWVPAEAGAAPDTLLDPMLAGSALAESAQPRAKGPDAERILLADDNPDLRQYITRLLEGRWRVEAVANGREALEAVRRSRPHLVITDVMMPELDGFGLIQALRSDPRTHDIPVLVLSARAGEEATIEGLQSGADDYLVKPFSARELTARVETQLLRARIRAVEETHGRRLASVFSQAPVAVALLRGPEHVFEVANQSYLALVNQRPVLGKTVREAFPELQHQGVIGILDTVYHSGRPYVGRSVPMTLNRGPQNAPEECFFDLVYHPLFDDAGRVEGIAAVGYDVTELAQARRTAEVANRTKDEFLAMLGHELRNPLAPILTALQLLQLRGIEAGERERQIIERQVRHLVALVDDLLDVSRLTRGKIQLKRARVELADVVAKAIETTSPLIEQNRHQLRVDVPRRGLAIDADADRMSQVVSNLLTNAAKYTEPGGAITISAGIEDQDVVLRVRDTGIGISSEILPRIFDLFTQERQAVDRARGGLGLGLAIVRSLVGMHGGDVFARSEGQGRGAEFVVRLPRSQQPAEVSAGAAASPAPAFSPSQTGCRILIVDDNEDAAVMLAESLRACGYDARVAHDAPSALKEAEADPPGVALLDIGLPAMDGYELAERFTSHPRLRQTRLIALTGYGQQRDRERSVDAGFAAHVVKPVDLEHLRAIVESIFVAPGPPDR